MLSEDEVKRAIEECEKSAHAYSDCEKLATFYTIHDHMAGRETVKEVREVVGEYGDSAFLKRVSGKGEQEAWLLMDELMSTLSLLMPKLYNSILSKL